MALVPTGFEADVVLVDSGNNTSTKHFVLVAADAAAAALAVTGTIIPALQAASNAKVSGYKISHVFMEDAFTYPLGGVEIENQALIIFRLDGDPRKKATYYVPAPVDGMFVSSSGSNRNVVDVTDAAVLALRDIFRAGTGVATISDGETVDVVESGKRIHRRSTRG